VGLIVPGGETVTFKDELNHLLAIADIRSNRAFVYYQGGAWNRSGFFSDEKTWVNYLKSFSEDLKQPLKVNY